MKPQIRGLLFDKDGTLFDFKGSWGRWIGDQIRALSGGDTALAERMTKSLGYDLNTGEFEASSVVIAGTPGEIVDAMLPHLEAHDYDSLLQHLVETSAHATQDEAVPLVPLLNRFLSAGLKIGVATNDAEAPARAHLASVSIENLFDFIVGFDSGHGAKPEPGMQKAFCAATGLAAREVAMVGDSTHDLIAGRVAGMVCIAVLTGIAERETLEPYADHVLNHVGELPDFLNLPPI